jgi:hypothetical protein
MNVLIWIVNLTHSFGEVTNAYTFAEELAKKGINVCFYRTNEFVENYLNFCSVKFKLLTQDEIKNHKFDLVIFSEYVFLYKGANFSPETIQFIADNFLNKIPIGTLDSINISGCITFEENRLVFHEPTHLLNFLPVIFPDKEYFFIVHVCPMNYPDENKGSPIQAFYWSRPGLDFNPELDDKIKEIFSIKPGTKQIFLPLSKWQPFYWYMDFSFIDNLSVLLGDFMTYLFENLNLDIDYTFFFGVPGYEFRKYQNKNFSAYYFIPDAGSYLSHPLYDQFLARTDLLLSIFFIQNSFIRSLHSGNKAINLTHRVFPVKEAIYQDDDFFLNDVVLNNFYVMDYNNETTRKNPYFSLFKSFELLDKDLWIFIKQSLLYGKTSIEVEKFQFYQSGLKSCLNADEIIKEVLFK